jgi:hypothetical protein
MYLNINFVSYNSFRILRSGIYLRSIRVADGVELRWAVTMLLHRTAEQVLKEEQREKEGKKEK